MTPEDTQLINDAIHAFGTQTETAGHTDSGEAWILLDAIRGLCVPVADADAREDHRNVLRSFLNT